MSDFEKLEERQGGKFTYDPSASKAENPMEGRSGERLQSYYGVTLAPAVVEEMKAWGTILNAIKDGIPKPFDNSIIIEKISRLENKMNLDLSQLKQCCPPSADVREAKELKPFIFGILDRVVDVTGIFDYVNKYRR